MAAADQSSKPATQDPFELTAKEKDTIDKAFSRLDRNGDGRISRDELKAGLILLGETPTKARLAELFGALDGNSNGYIDQEEFKAMMADKFAEGKLKKAYTRAAFDMLDKNQDGHISREEIAQVVKDIGYQLSPVIIQDMLKQADTNKDGKINYKEFSKALWRRASSDLMDL